MVPPEPYGCRVSTSPAGDLWASFPRDPRDPAHAGLRASDAERELIAAELGEAFADGRLDREEHDERTATLWRAKTLGELPPLVADLVAERPASPAGLAPLASSADIEARAELKWRSERRDALMAFLYPNLICWAIYLFTAFPGGFYWPWPVIVTIATGLNTVRRLASHDEVVDAERRRLEKKERRQLDGGDEA
jgi:hypothetical protein